MCFIIIAAEIPAYTPAINLINHRTIGKSFSSKNFPAINKPLV
jgi:hypothetical protein